ncbi:MULTISPECIES: sugar porter family MFS transporter [unclassified Leeuwenhoekiella]|uniref:sugar porter family MFS transporter n=1 Tax=unclassified Leeuwenhoekiella TaxID=2615029 RepID=UPI000C3599B4|nr:MULTISPECIES: sugar porter family MFS transporter [unclassified Leeuwenhoekiella]MAW94354.1 MFS transporter [Leeuwenhoekiella sp.]MBA81030.1 MFS transporter [Leeuwenhoekiella sp.]|tara:strand:- start:25575 stop:26984 length:1410 start_codon:yes stop_codon:yes gene_type:complete
MENVKFNFKYLLFLALVSAMGGFLFGYDWVVIGGAKPFYELYFEINALPSLQGWAMSSALVGCILGAVLSGVVADRYGRKNPLILAALLFTISAFGTGYADHFTPFIIYRLIGGLGIGLASTLSPMYIAEIAPAKYRGQFVAINQLTIVVGILAAQVANYAIAETIPDGMTPQEILASWNGQTGWRWMFWAELIPAGLFFILMFIVPKSPRFLAKINQNQAALKVLSAIGGSDYAENELNNMKLTLKESSAKKIKLSELKSKRVLPILTIGIVLAFFQQWCGINIIFNYAEEIFTAAGYSVGDMLFNIIITGSVNLVFTFVAMRTVDSWGRRKLMLFGSIGLAVVYALLGGAYYFEFNGLPVLILVIVAIAIYAMSLAPITWVVLSEIFPNRLRGIAMSIATFSLWVASFILTFTFPILNDLLGSYGTFWVYSGICVFGFLFIKSKLPETKGKSLEEIEFELSNQKTSK